MAVLTIAMFCDSKTRHWKRNMDVEFSIKT
jgi:hypothetical protein